MLYYVNDLKELIKILLPITFENIFTLGEVAHETQLFSHYHLSTFLDMYDANYVTFKKNPTILEFKETELYLRNKHQEKKQNHLKFRFVTDTLFLPEVHQYLFQENYQIDLLELFTLNKEKFPILKPNDAVEVKLVTSDNLIDLLDLRYGDNIQYGKEYALKKNDLITQQLKLSYITFLVAYYKGIPAGCVNLIESDQGLEIDDLFVRQNFRNKQLASFLQREAIFHAKDKQVFLTAYADDTPRNMYLKQGYQLISTQYEILNFF